MQPTQHATALGVTTQEVLLRTLASDIASVKQGSQTPVAEHLTAQFNEKNAAADTSSGGAHGGAYFVKLFLALLFLGGIAFAFYTYVYPSLTQATL